jgi:hypothetical protein
MKRHYKDWTLDEEQERGDRDDGHDVHDQGGGGAAAHRQQRWSPRATATLGGGGPLAFLFPLVGDDMEEFLPLFAAAKREEFLRSGWMTPKVWFPLNI